LFDKTLETNWLVALHQDLSIPVKERVDSPQCLAWSVKEGVTFVQPPSPLLAALIAVRVHLDDCRLDNGPLRVIPGSHRYGRLSSEEAQSHRRANGEVACMASRGAALLMRPLLLHASSKAVADMPRRVLHFLFGPQVLPYGLQWHHAV
jgi:ectoine hydroxylase-related dioxygenase (phytanoyl-CoA dioxygenase family)